MKDLIFKLILKYLLITWIDRIFFTVILFLFPQPGIPNQWTTITNKPGNFIQCLYSSDINNRKADDDYRLPVFSNSFSKAISNSNSYLFNVAHIRKSIRVEKDQTTVAINEDDSNNDCSIISFCFDLKSKVYFPIFKLLHITIYKIVLLINKSPPSLA